MVRSAIRIDIKEIRKKCERQKQAARREREKMKVTLEQAAWVVRKLREHMDKPGSYRWLIYERMGFGPDAYAVLMDAGLLDIHNRIVG